MHSLSVEYLDGMSFMKRHIAMFRAIGEAKGKQELFSQRSQEALDNLKGLAAIESTISSNRIEGVVAKPGRAEAIMLKASKPRNRAEEEIAGYRDALRMIHESWADMNFSITIIKQLHDTILRYSPDEGGSWKTKENIIGKFDEKGRLIEEVFKPTSARNTPEAMELLVERYDVAIKEGYDPLVVIPLTILDFLSIHPFEDGNGRIARLLTLLLLYQSGYIVGRYISLERIIEESKETYYETLNASSQGWHEEKHDWKPWATYFWGVILRAYKEFEERVGEVTTSFGSKTEQVELAVRRRIGPFSFSEIERECPEVSKDMIRHVLRQLRDEGRLQSEGTGRGARWNKIEGEWD